MSPTPDLVILGSGSTAFAAALRAQSHGARVVMVEKSELGGTCVNWGCVPSKTLIAAAADYHRARQEAPLGLGSAAGAVDWPALAARKDRVVAQLRQTRYLDVLAGIDGLELVTGHGRFLDRQRIAVDGRTIAAERFLVATGGFPRVIRFPGLDQVHYLTSQSALMMRELPASLIIIGGGVIALEMGQMYRRFGVAVTVLEHGPRVLLPVEPEPALAVQEALAAEGMTIRVNVDICGLAERDGQTVVATEVAGEWQEFVAERVLLAIGTAPASGGIGLEQTGVAVDAHGFISVDAQMRTSVPGIWAAGDVIGGMMIATAGAREAVVAVDDMFAPGCGCTMDHLTTPMAIFTDPEVGCVGYTEAAARVAGLAVMTNTLEVSAIPKAQVTGWSAGVIKMVADRESRRLLGVHLACDRGADLINEAALALRARLTVDDLAQTLHVYPSIGEGLRLCAQGFSRDVSKLSCCAE
jgi:mercuric reductase